MDRTTLTAKLKPLQRRDLVTVTADPGDRRSRLLALTDAGRTVLAAAVQLWRRTHAAIEHRLGDACAERLRIDLNASF
jgi:DNA-binding MarR family transcriptional regulator